MYENTLVDPHTRSVQDIYATPRELAEYIVNSLPFELLPTDQRTVFEPFAGHAPFLIAAMSRLRGLLPADATAKQRHKHCVRMLAGMEIEPFAREVARYSLMLADYPNPNGWKISAGDVFASAELDAQLKTAQIVLCNPPFGDFTKEERAANASIQRPNKAAEVLRRVLERPPAMLGFIVPRLFTQGSGYRELRERLAALYADTSLLVLPEVAFRHSRAETVLVIAHGRQGSATRRRSAYVSKSDYPEFLRSGKLTWEDRGETSLPDPHPQLWTPPLLAHRFCLPRWKPRKCCS
ncbi:MAG: N-6 DNA methylase [Planctomycetota bacterium]